MAIWNYILLVCTLFLLYISRCECRCLGKFWLAWQILGELMEKRGLKSYFVEWLLLLLAGLLTLPLLFNYGFLMYSLVMLFVLFFYISLVLKTTSVEKNILNQNFVIFKTKIKNSISAPNPFPHLIIRLRGPFFESFKSNYLVGDMIYGIPLRFQAIVHNPSLIPSRIKRLSIEVKFDKRFFNVNYPKQIESPASSEFEILEFEITPIKLSQNPLDIKLIFSFNDEVKWKKNLKIESIFDSERSKIIDASIDRWKYGAKAAFAWRGDMDLHDPSTFQDARGLRTTLGVAKRFRIPSTLYISGRLSFNKDELQKFGEKLGHIYYPDLIDKFVKFLKDEVQITDDSEYPYESEKPYVIEIGNHMYLHYGTYAAMSEDNGWTSHALPGSYIYSWQKRRPFNSLNQQIDNIELNQIVIKKVLKVTPTSWGVPGRTNDNYTSQAVLKSGIKISSDAFGSIWDNIWELNVPEHPPGAEDLIEVHKVYPGDPRNFRHYYMLRFWLRYAVKNNKGFVFMVHHHLRMYEGWMCYRLTEEIFRHILEDWENSFWITTVSGMAKYWEDVLCDKHKKIKLEISNNTVKIENLSRRDYHYLPLTIKFEGGKKTMMLVNVKAGEKRSLL